MTGKMWLLLTAVLCGTGIKGQQLGTLTVEKIMRDPKKWLGTSPSAIEWSEDSRRIYFKWNPEKHPDDSLYVYDINTRKILKVTPSEQKSLPAAGSYDREKLRKIYSQNGDLFLLNCATGHIRRLTGTVEAETKPVFSGDGRQVIFLRGDNLFGLHLSGDRQGETVQYTDFKAVTKKAEVKENAYEKWLKADQTSLFEVLRERKEKKEAGERYGKLMKPVRPKEVFLGDKKVNNLRISPDLRYVTYTLTEVPREVKGSLVPNYVTLSGFSETLPARPKVGAPQGKEEFWIYDIPKDTVRRLDWKEVPGIGDQPAYFKEYARADSSEKPRMLYASGPFYSPAGTHAVVVLRAADNKDRWIMLLDPGRLSLKLLDRQHDEAWVGGPGIGGYAQSEGNLGWINENELYFQSEASGYSHLYTVNVLTGDQTALTSGKFEVLNAVLSRDSTSFFLTTNEAHPGEQHFYKMAVSGGKRTRLTVAEGAHEVTLSPDERRMAIRYSNSTTLWELFVAPVREHGKPEQVTRSVSDEFRSYPWRKAKIVTIPASDGQSIYARVYEPRKSNGKAVIFVHGAGYLQNAHKWWSQYFREYMFHNLLADSGYTVLDMDYRASSGYGRDWRTGIYRFMGGKDLSDNVDGARWLVRTYGVDAARIGIYGGSYGGFITLMAQFTAPGVFAAGAALRPVTDWASYNHPYTSNILNEPVTDSLAYRKSSPIYHAEGLTGKLLICHGMLDVNVHFQDVVRLSQRLIELGKENWELAVYPLEDHGFVEASSWIDEYKRILKLFETL